MSTPIILVLLAIILLQTAFLINLRSQREEYTFYRVKDGQIEKSTQVEGGSGSPIWERVKNQVTVNCSGSWPGPTWSEADYRQKNYQLEECRKKFGALNEGRTWI